MIKVGVVEDNEPYRRLLETLVKSSEGLELVFSASNCADFLSVVNVACPEVIVMDIKMTGMSGIECVKAVKQICPNVNIFMLTSFEDEEYIFESIKAGAIGYLLKKDAPEEIVQAIRKAHKGEAVMNGMIARKVLEYYSKTAPKQQDFQEYKLTPRETELLELLIEGFSYKEIAAKLGISIDTVFSHVRKIYTKLNVHSRSEIAAKFR